MFTAAFSESDQANRVKSNMGVNLRLVQCNKLHPDPLYSNYSKDELHYVIEAVQKGRNPHTQTGLKRLIKKNAAKELQKKLALRVNKNNKGNQEIPQLNPKSPEEICMKAVRTQFRYKISKNHMQAEKPAKAQMTEAMKIRKQNQRMRRIELIKLSRKYRDELYPHFGTRMYGYSRCPKVSRKEVIDYLKTLGIEANTNPYYYVDVQDEKEQEEARVPLFKDEDFPSLMA